MEAYRCDGCNKVSPDEDGLHIANSWADVRIKSRHNAGTLALHVCDDCMPMLGSRKSIVLELLTFLKGRKAKSDVSKDQTP
jgi:hypothetical protein